MYLKKHTYKCDMCNAVIKIEKFNTIDSYGWVTLREISIGFIRKEKGVHICRACVTNNASGRGGE